ncbi:MAG TPA: CBS domain-containing protein [Actinomycetota bacterium]|jgi:CBS domain-containing protein|nr:CBS domain-containing protein [Actinomycetota bacterium]
MPQSIKEVMTPNPTTLPLSATAEDAATKMRDENIGDVLIVDADGLICGIVTDRDIALQVVASGADPKALKLEHIGTKEVNTLPSDATIEKASALMREKAIRRLPVVDKGKPVGIVSLGDLAIEKDPSSALAQISSAPPDRVRNGKVGARVAVTRAARVFPAAASGAVLALSVGHLRGRRRSAKDLAAKRIRKAGKKLRKAGGRMSAGPAGKAAEFASKRVDDVKKLVGAGAGKR